MQSQTHSKAKVTVRALSGLAALSALFIFAPTASATAPRSYVGQIGGFEKPQAAFVMPNDDVWIADVQNTLISHFSPYPANETLGVQKSQGHWGGNLEPRTFGVSEANGFLYAAIEGEGGGCGFEEKSVIFDNFGQFWKETSHSCNTMIAVNNAPQSAAYGNYFEYGPGPVIHLYDGYSNPVNFTGTAPYISGSTLTGTPSGGIGGGGTAPESGGIVIDDEGNIWVNNNKEILEFAESGIFIQRITAKSAGGVPASNLNPTGPKAFAAFPGLTGIAVDPTNGHVLVADRAGMLIDEFSETGKFLGQIDGTDTPAGKFGYLCINPFIEFCYSYAFGIAVDSKGHLYVTDDVNQVVDVFGPTAATPKITDEPDSNPTATGGTVNATIDPNGGGAITSCKVEYGTSAEFVNLEYKKEAACNTSSFSTPTQVHADITGLTTEATYHYRFTVSNGTTSSTSRDHSLTPHNVLGLRAEQPTNIAPTGATLNGSFVGNGAATSYWFEYGKTKAYGTTMPASPASAGSPAGPGRTPLEIALSGLEPATTYHFRVVANNGSLSNSDDLSFRTKASLPQVRASVSELHSSEGVFTTEVNPGGADTEYNIEYGTEPCSNPGSDCALAFPGFHIGSNRSYDTDVRHLTGLEPGTTYYYRVVATNATGTTEGQDLRFSTYPFTPDLRDPCGDNTLARQQTGAALLSDCRGYELVSASRAGGYDVESTLVPDQIPFEGYPRAEGPLRVLYGVHNGAIPGVPGNPTNRGVDPYVATRDASGWKTSYVGIPANNPFASAPFSSTLAEADPSLENFAFAGPEICNPCFGDGTTGVPLHLPDGTLVQGMKGSIEPPSPASDDGLVKKRFSADGNHFVFSSTSQFELAGNDETGDVSIYNRDLRAGTTEVVSNDQNGNPLACLQGAGACHGPGNADGIAELGISADGSRVLVGQRISTDAAGNDYFHLFLHLAGSPSSVDLTPGAGAGALYDGMTADATSVFLTTTDKLLSADTDTSADIYEAAVSGGGALTLRLLSTAEGAPSNDDGCEPPGDPDNWNSASGAGKCGAVALAGGAGVAAGDGTFYFFSPELLDGAAQAEGEENQPNLYTVQPGGDPEFVATVDTSATKPGPKPKGYVERKTFISGLEGPEDIAVDQSNGDVYVAQRETQAVARFTSNGAPRLFSEGPGSGSNEIPGLSLGFGGEGQVAVDNAPGAGVLTRALYVTSNGGSVQVFSPSGAELGELSGFSEACGVAVDQSTGAVYVADYIESALWRFVPSSPSGTIDDSDYTKTGIHTEILPCVAGADTEGHAYAGGYGGGPIMQYDVSDFTAAIPTVAGTEIAPYPANKIAVDPTNNDHYINTGEQITWTDSSGNVLGELGAPLEFSQGVAVFNDGSSKRLYMSNEGNVLKYDYNEANYSPIDNPAVVHAVHRSGTHDWSDFQVTPSGDYAIFATRAPLEQGFQNNGHNEIYRYSTTDGSLDCVSCPPTNAPGTEDAQIASRGLGLADDGRVFFNTDEPIVLRDADGRQDVYEWQEEGTGPKPGGCEAGNPNLFPSGNCVSLISTGTSQFDSGLLSSTGSGHDVFFFTHDTLVHGDDNGPVAKLYDARTAGGVFAVPPPAACVASDECHGPGTVAATPPAIRTIAGAPANEGAKAGAKAPKCRKGFAKRHGKCVRKKSRKKAKRRHKSRGGRR